MSMSRIDIIGQNGNAFEDYEMTEKERVDAFLARERQVGGKHYTSKKIQPWDVIEANQMGFFDGNALKYIMRYKDKNGVEDLRKAIHYLERLIEMEFE